MEVRTKTVQVFVSHDEEEFTSEKDCREHERDLKIKALHSKLLDCNFHKRFKIVPYFHNYEVTNLGPASYWKEELDDNLSFVLVRGRMGNGDDRVKYRKNGKNLVLIRYSLDADIAEQVYLGKIPYSWTELNQEELQVAVDEYLSKRKVYKKVVTQHITSEVKYEEI